MTRHWYSQESLNKRLGEEVVVLEIASLGRTYRQSLTLTGHWQAPA